MNTYDNLIECFRQMLDVFFSEYGENTAIEAIYLPKELFRFLQMECTAAWEQNTEINVTLFGYPVRCAEDFASGLGLENGVAAIKRPGPSPYFLWELFPKEAEAEDMPIGGLDDLLDMSAKEYRAYLEHPRERVAQPCVDEAACAEAREKLSRASRAGWQEFETGTTSRSYVTTGTACDYWWQPYVDITTTVTGGNYCWQPYANITTTNFTF